MKDTLLKYSIEGSLLIQVITLFLNLYSFFIPVAKWDSALKEILGLETFVQIIELVFYSWYRERLIGSENNITQYRYYDWFLTTPTMLFSTASFYGYLDAKQSDSDAKKPFSVLEFFQTNSNWILVMVLLNAFMLFFGYLHEMGLLSIVWSSLFGYLALLGSFGLLYTKVASKVPEQQGLFRFMVFVWSLYGIAAVFPSREKNISYNVLDVFAKNFYGIFLSYYIYQRKI